MDRDPEISAYVSMDGEEEEKGFEITQFFSSSSPQDQLRQRRRRRNHTSKSTLTVQETLFDLERNQENNDCEEEEDTNGGSDEDEDTNERRRHQRRRLQKIKAHKSLKESMEEFLKLSATENPFLYKSKRNTSHESPTSVDLGPYERLENFIEEEFPEEDYCNALRADQQHHLDRSTCAKA